MSKRTIKTLNNTGRISRSKAHLAISELRQTHFKTKKVSTTAATAKISKNTTASGRSKIAFHISNIKDTKSSRKVS